MKKNNHYNITKNGYSITGSNEIFNRTLYGSHKNDDKISRFFTFAGDAPEFMGALTDWTKSTCSLYSKCGTLMSGLALTPGQRVGFFYSDDIDISSRWFHNSEDITAEFRSGWMEYNLTQISPWFPDVSVNMEVYPMMSDDGFVVHYKISTDQRTIFVAGFGGITDYMGRFEYKDEKKRNFSESDCVGNKVEIFDNYVNISGCNNCNMQIAATFPVSYEVGSAKSLASPYPSEFLSSKPCDSDDEVVKISAVINPGKVLDGYIYVFSDADETIINKWLKMADPERYIKQQIYQKFNCIKVHTPDELLDITIPPTVIALDASWHENSFHHGAFGYHAPFLGWRNWYAPTQLGWYDRVEKTIEAHLNQLVKQSDGEEKIWYDGDNPPEGSGPSPYHSIKNSTGYLPYFLGVKDAYYNMQECAFDMMLYYIEWSGNVELAKRHFDDFSMMLDWEERVLDTDGDGLYQNFLNTWISDGHEYNGAGCAQSSAYNYRANMVMAKLAKQCGLQETKFIDRANKIKKAINNKLWVADKGVLAESIDTIGNCLLHAEPELSTAYLAIDCGLVNDFQAYTMLKYTEEHIKSIETINKGRLSYSSNWLPKKYSTYGIFPSENSHLALAYYKVGLREKGKKILDGIEDCYISGKNPGMAAHIQSSKCTADLADLDFTDVSSTYLRAVVEGLYGIKINAVDNCIYIAPGFPDEWTYGSLSLKDISLNYHRCGNHEYYEIYCDRDLSKNIKIPMKSASVEGVFLNGEPVDYKIVTGINNSFINVVTDNKGRLDLSVIHGKDKIPSVISADKTFAENTMVFEVDCGEITGFYDSSSALDSIEIINNKVYAKCKDKVNNHTLFIHVKEKDFDSWLTADFNILQKEMAEKVTDGKGFEPLNISAYFNCNMKDVHSKKYLSPRPKGYSIGMLPDGRYAWEWNHKGHNKVYVDDNSLRNSGGTIKVDSGITFNTAVSGNNLACVSMWDNFPDELKISLSGRAKEIALLFVSTTSSMQTGVENARITVEYKDEEQQSKSLVYPENIDDWLVPALQTENEIFYFNDYNHGTVQRIILNENKDLKEIKIKAIANEVIIGVIGISIKR